MNQSHILGNIGAEPEFFTFESGSRKANFSVAINSYNKDKDKRKATWIAVELWADAAARLEKCRQYGPLKGRTIQVSGPLANSEYKEMLPDGQVRNRRKMYVNGRSFELLDGKPAPESGETESEEEAVMVVSEAKAEDQPSTSPRASKKAKLAVATGKSS